MATYINNYGEMGSTSTSCYGVTGCKWKPRKVSAKRDFPKAFGEVAMNHTKLSKVEPPALLDVPQNISDDDHDDVSQFPKKRKVYGVKELSKVTAGDYIENAAPVESEEGFTNTGKFDLSNENTDIVRDDYSKNELVTSNSVSGESSCSTDMRGSDYDMRPHTTIEHEDTDAVELINTDEVTHFAKRKVSAIRCFPPGCGRNAFAQSEDELENDGHDDVSQFPKKRKVSAVKELSKVTDGDYIENAAPVESEKGFSNTGKFDLSNDSNDIVRDDYSKYELVTSDSVSVESSRSTDMPGSDYDMRPHTTIENEDTDVVELINTDKMTHYAKRKVSAIRCFPPGCGRNAFAQSEEELKNGLAEFENYSSTCKTCRDDDIEEESYGEAESDNYLKDELVPFELDSVFVESSSSTEMCGSDYDIRPRTIIEHEDTDVIELINTDKETRLVKRKVSAIRCFPPGCGRNTFAISEEELEKDLAEFAKYSSTCEACRDADDIEEDSYSEAESDDYTELAHEENAEEKRQYQTDGQIELQIIVANLHNNEIDVEPAREESGIHKSVSYRMMDEERDPAEQLGPRRPRAWAVRCFPPGCGPDAVNLTEEDVKLALTESRKGMLTCKSCRRK